MTLAPSLRALVDFRSFHRTRRNRANVVMQSSEAKDYALARVATTTFPAPRIPATSPSMRAHPSSFHLRPCAPAPSQLPEYPTPAWDSPQISCAAPAWDSASATVNRPPNPCTRCTRCPPTDSPHLLLPSSLCC